ncbi:BZ3500_MvSof-1268-A1-R1_Chr5-2g07881 [Microbotryum saponariae]|uniref:Malic enzyme n=1 Tax=Microbotryum saponariae TaxID=289078 RepID=A0A2X0LKI5_9BASI|nr:BZ3500_MvSof-1268-A1-R1_Chr5-2g07881 [Microbotryum saponariae]SDA05750.1 BZ3501_MvSof-1269-A2-R1_Chr5-2g07703 [Microbotryum saponariae]
MLPLRRACRSFATTPLRSYPIAEPTTTTKSATATTRSEEHIEHPKNYKPLYTHLKGRALLNEPSLNKGAAFSKEERDVFGLNGLLPAQVHDLDMQCQRAYGQLKARTTPLSKYTFLTSLREQNQVLFYNFVLKHLNECLPVIYTPTAIQKYSTIWRRSAGLFITEEHFDRMREIMITNRLPKNVDLIVVTDSEGILGIGDQGVGGVLITVGKGNIYTLGAGINPARILNVVLDVGTNNQDLLNDPLYLGVKSPRLTGERYDRIVDKFCNVVRESYPDAFLHFEDFGTKNAGRILQKYRPKQSCFNDDMQGTAAVVLAALMSAAKVTATALKDQRICVFGFGTAGLGIADGIRNALMIEEGLSPEEANKRFCCWTRIDPRVLDRPGLLTTGVSKDQIRSGQEHYLRDESEVEGWAKDARSGISLLEVVKQAKPTVLIGCSGMSNAFTEEVRSVARFKGLELDLIWPNPSAQIVREMSKNCDRPCIFPLSNPTRLAEANPSDLNEWSNGRALIATGSPFPLVKNVTDGKMYKTAESNNALVYPGLALGVVLSKASALTDSMITAGVTALAELAPALNNPNESLLPPLEDLRSVSVKIATAVANQARAEGLAKTHTDRDWTEEECRLKQWDPVYRPLELVDSA